MNDNGYNFKLDIKRPRGDCYEISLVDDTYWDGIRNFGYFCDRKILIYSCDEDGITNHAPVYDPIEWNTMIDQAKILSQLDLHSLYNILYK